MEMGQNGKGIGQHRIEPYRPKAVKTHYAVALIAVGLVIGVVMFLGLTAFGGLDVVRTWFKLS